MSNWPAHRPKRFRVASSHESADIDIQQQRSASSLVQRGRIPAICVNNPAALPHSAKLLAAPLLAEEQIAPAAQHCCKRHSGGMLLVSS
jgi:hypothetical protein